MKIYVVGSSKNKFLPLDNIREKFLIDKKHEGDNIDFLNPWYCELTGLYYLWKHCDDDIVGLEHYRAYFWNEDHKMNETEILDKLKLGDIIVSGYHYPAPWGPTTLIQELNICTKNKVEPFLKVVEQKDKGFASYLRTFLQGQRIYACNCFIGPKKILNEWASFFFETILDFEKTNPIGPGTNTLRREGYFSEFAFGAWLEYKGYKPVISNLRKFNKDFSSVHQNMLGPDKRL